jgi:asparagine synthetase B (glutamine-hydrolysing)
MNEGTDLLYARKVAEHIGSNHKEVFFTPEEGLAAIRDVIYTTETWDTTTIRASTGQYLVCKHIGTKTDARVVMVGEGPDEVCSSYLFNYYAPSGKALDDCAREYVEKIHMFDGRRADRCISRWGLEGRVALLDPEFISTYWKIPSESRHPKDKGIEKWWLRKAFDGTDILPECVLWRKKEAFSDGISSKEKSWFQRDFGLDLRLIKALSKLGYTYPTVVQAKSIPIALQGKDILVRARTGSGKTAAFLLPLLHKILISKETEKEVFLEKKRRINIEIEKINQLIRKELNESIIFSEKATGKKIILKED